MSTQSSSRDATIGPIKAKGKHPNKSTNFNNFFQNGRSTNETNTAKGDQHVLQIQNLSTSEAVEPTPVSTADPLTIEEMTSMIENLTAVVKTVTENLRTTSDKIRKYRTTPTLGVLDDTNVSEQELPLLAKFKTYTLPMQKKEDIEKLEVDLTESHEFLKFFVRHIYFFKFSLN